MESNRGGKKIFSPNWSLYSIEIPMKSLHTAAVAAVVAVVFAVQTWSGSSLRYLGS